MKHTLLVVLMASSCVLLRAQTASFEGNKSASEIFLQKIVPPSPTATSLGKYGDQQIGMFTGIPSINIPIYQLKFNGYTIPISISYTGSGLRVSEAASSVGLGWTLNGGGVVTRVVRGQPDNGNAFNIREFPFPTGYNISDNAWNYIHGTMASGYFDPEPDLYIVKTPTFSVKFYFDQHNRIQTVPYDNETKIKFDVTGDQFIVTGADGTQYYFGGATNNKEVTYSANPSYAAYVSSWFLYKIVTANNEDILFTNVKGLTDVFQDQYSETEEILVAPSADCVSHTGAGRTVSWSNQTFLPVFMDKIDTPLETVYFIRDVAQRQDLPGEFAIIGIQVFSKMSNRVEFSYTFNYSYFPQTLTNCGGDITHLHNKTAICKRLRLDSFSEKGIEGNTVGFKTHQFQYNTEPVPPRCSLAQDFWGYYNHAANTSLLPDVTDPDFNGSSFNAISREPDHNYADAGLLLKIIYPTGGETNFTYEPNEIKTLASGQTFQTATASISGAGSTLSQSVNFSITTPQIFNLNFSLEDLNLPDQGLQRKVEIFNSSGDLIYLAINDNSGTAGILVFEFATQWTLPAGTYTLKVSRNFQYSDYPTIPPMGISATVTYKTTGAITWNTRKVAGFRIRKTIDKSDAAGSNYNIREYFYENPLLIANIQNNDCIGDYDRWFVLPNGVNTTPCYYKGRYTSAVQPLGSIQGSHIAYGKVTSVHGLNGSNGKSEHFYSVDPDAGGYGKSPVYRPVISYDHRRGNLLKQIDYDASGNIIKIMATTYDNELKSQGQFVRPYYSRDEPITGLTSPSKLPYKVITYTDYIYPSEWVRPIVSTMTFFHGSAYTTTIKRYSYDNPNYSYATTIDETDSKGNTKQSFDSYPLDAKPVNTQSNEEIERKFEVDYQTIYNTFYTAASTATGTALTNAYNTYKTSLDNLRTTRNSAISNYAVTFSTLANGTADPVLKGKYQLIAKNKLQELVQNRLVLNSTTELRKRTYDFKDFSGNILLEKSNQSFSGNTLETELKIDAYDAFGNVLQASRSTGIIESFIWDYSAQYLIAKTINASSAHTAYTSFESDGKGNWSFSGVPFKDITAPSGKMCYKIGNSISRNALSSTGSYIVSYWKKSGTIAVSGSASTLTGRVVNGWTYFEHKVNNPASGIITITGTNGIIDELRLYPSTAMMNTYCYEPIKGITREIDANNRINYYEYDEMNRLILIRDQDRNIIKKVSYNYAGQAENTSIYYNVVKTGTKKKGNCSGCQVGTAVTYTVPAESYVSTVSQSVADNQAIADVIANEQDYADANGSCVAPGTAPTTANNGIANSFAVQFHNNCTNTNYNFMIPASTSNFSLSGMVEGEYTVTFTPTGGTGTYAYRVNGTLQSGVTIGNFVAILQTGSNLVNITPPL